MTEQLTSTHVGIVTPDQIDELGHMNVRWYGHRAREGTRILCERLGIGSPAIASAYTRHHHEQLEGSTLEVTSGVLGGTTGLRLYHELRNQADGDLAATFIHDLDHVAIESPSVTLPDYGKPRTLDLESDRFAGAPSLDTLRARGLEARLPRAVTADDVHPNDLFWAGDRPDGETSWITETDDGEQIASATMESRFWIRDFPAVGTQIQSFMANIYVGEKITHELGWVFDLDNEVLIAAFEGVDLTFSITHRRSTVMPASRRNNELDRLDPHLGHAALLARDEPRTRTTPRPRCG